MGRSSSAVAWVGAITTFLLLMASYPPRMLPSIPGAPGLPIFYAPPIVYWLLMQGVRRLPETWAEIANKSSLILFAAGCAILCFGALSAPFHRVCVEGSGSRDDFECDRYESRPGGDLAQALIWGAASLGALSIAGFELRLVSRTASGKPEGG